MPETSVPLDPTGSNVVILPLEPRTKPCELLFDSVYHPATAPLSLIPLTMISVDPGTSNVVYFAGTSADKLGPKLQISAQKASPPVCMSRRGTGRMAIRLRIIFVHLNPADRHSGECNHAKVNQNWLQGQSSGQSTMLLTLNCHAFRPGCAPRAARQGGAYAHLWNLQTGGFINAA